MKSLHTLALVTSLAGVCSGATIVQTKTYEFVPTGNQSLTFDKFDTTLGTLTSVTVSVNVLKSGGTYSVDNDSATAGTIDLVHNVIGQLSSGDVSLRKTGAGTVYVGQSGSITASNVLNTTIGATTGDPTNAFNATGLADYVTFSPTDSTASDSGTIRAADQADYETVGAGTFNILFTGTQDFSATGVSGLQQAFTVSNVSGDVTVTYNFTAVPEPASALLGGIGLLSLLRRRRR